MTALTPKEEIGPNRYRFTVEQFYELAKVGILAPDERVELFDGAVLTMALPSPEQGYAIANLNRFVMKHTSEEMRVDVHNPIHLDQHNESRPSLCLSRRRSNQYAHPMPGDLLFVVEVLDDTPNCVRSAKLPRYAAAGIAESWLFDVSSWSLERHTDLRDGVYQQIARAERGQSLASTTLPAITLAVDDLLR
ncbi:MAG: Uma2 family endonuclease [Chloroflexia bacterium]